MALMAHNYMLLYSSYVVSGIFALMFCRSCFAAHDFLTNRHFWCKNYRIKLRINFRNFRLAKFAPNFNELKGCAMQITVGYSARTLRTEIRVLICMVSRKTRHCFGAMHRKCSFTIQACELDPISQEMFIHMPLSIHSMQHCIMI